MQTNSDRSLRSRPNKGMKSPKVNKGVTAENTQNSQMSVTYKIPQFNREKDNDQNSSKPQDDIDAALSQSKLKRK